NRDTCPIENCTTCPPIVATCPVCGNPVANCTCSTPPVCTGNRDTCPIENCTTCPPVVATCPVCGNPVANCTCSTPPVCTGNRDTCPIENCTTCPPVVATCPVCGNLVANCTCLTPPVCTGNRDTCPIENCTTCPPVVATCPVCGNPVANCTCPTPPVCTGDQATCQVPNCTQCAISVPDCTVCNDEGCAICQPVLSGGESRIFDMQTYAGFAAFNGTNTADFGFFRRVSNADAFEMTATGTAPDRVIGITGRSGTSQGININLDQFPARANHSYRIEVEGTIVAGGNFRFRGESATQITTVSGTPTGISHTFPASVFTTGRMSIGNDGSGTANMTITMLMITRICPDSCANPLCATFTVTFLPNGGTRTGGGQLTQTVSGGGDAVLPQLSPPSVGYRLTWDPPNAHRNVTANQTINAVWNPPTVGGICPAITAHEVVSQMGVGWNLGNQFDAYNGNSYSNPFTRDYSTATIDQLELHWLGGSSEGRHATRALLQNVYDAGFGTIRIPVTWYKAIIGVGGDNTSSTRHIGNFTIRPEWMARIRQVVDWAYDIGFTVILNTHHDEFIMPFRNAGEMATTNATITRLWTLIGNEFNDDFGERLVFEVLNEPRIKGGVGEWQGGGARGDAEARGRRERLNTMNQAAVNSIRATGGNNRHRVLMIPTHGASPHNASWGDAFDGFAMPTDPVSENANKFALSIHSYQTENWSGVAGVDAPWTESSITNMMNPVQQRATEMGVPVVLGEWGSVARHDDPNHASETGERANHARFYVQQATLRGMATVIWDTCLRGLPMQNEGRFGLFNRRNVAFVGTSGVSTPAHSLRYTHMVNAILEGYQLGGGLSGIASMSSPISFLNERIVPSSSFGLESAFSLFDDAA
ncbi:MAG: cellulase family glycosylhydrolase, partial [Oscillospiraceae bacterium]|nr:cellulase family glycosylhydrolase [Oscillospiraceae bacterium]